MAIWSAEIKELVTLYESFKSQLPELDKELEKLIKADDENMVLLYSRRCLEVIITDLCECELKRPRKTEPLKGIIDKLNKEGKVPSHIISSMHGLNELSTFGAHPKEFDPEQVKPVLNNLATIIKWYLKYKGYKTISKEETDQKETAYIELHTNKESIIDSSGSPFTKGKSGKSIHGKIVVRAGFMILILIGVLGLWKSIKPDSDNLDNLSIYATIPLQSCLNHLWYQYPFFSISSDGTKIAYISDQGIHIRSLSNLAEKLLEGTDGAYQVAFSPDGQTLAFANAGKIYKIGINGSPKSLVCSDSPSGGMTWGTDGYIYYSPIDRGIWRISANGGDTEQLTSLIDSLGEMYHTWPQLLPDSKTLLYTSIGPSGGSLDSRIVIHQLNSGEGKVLVNKALFGRYLSNGNIIYANNEGDLITIPFDLHKLKITGEPVVVLSGVNTATVGGAVYFSVSENGNLIFLPRIGNAFKVLDVVDRSGKLLVKDSIPLKTLLRMGPDWTSINISPSGNQIAFDRRATGSMDIWVLNLDTKDAERITFDPGEEETPVWSPDGNGIAYTASISGAGRQLMIQNKTNAGNHYLLRIWPRHIHLTSWSPDGKWLGTSDLNSTQGNDCIVIPVDSGGSVPIAVTNAQEGGARFSPDGRWIAYTSNESGRNEIYAVSFPKLENKIQISLDGGVLPRWDRSGKFIYYLNGDFLIAHPVESKNELVRGHPVRLFQANASDFVPSPDGQKFYLVRKNIKKPNPSLSIIINWFQQL